MINHNTWLAKVNMMNDEGFYMAAIFAMRGLRTKEEQKIAMKNLFYQLSTDGVLPYSNDKIDLCKVQWHKVVECIASDILV